jgi:hypothetical protein
MARFARWTGECARPHTSILVAGRAALLVSCTFVTVTADGQVVKILGWS